MNIDRLYLYLLNRKPNLEERKKYVNTSISVINNIIIQGTEYQNFTRNKYQLISNKILTKFKLPNTSIEKAVLYKIYNLFRANQYSSVILEDYIQDKKNIFEIEIEKIISILFQSYFTNMTHELQNLKREWLLLYINSNFSMSEVEFKIVLSNYYYQFVSQKIEKLL